MKNVNLVLLLCQFTFYLNGQINHDLKTQLDSIQKIDQDFREEVFKVMSNKDYLDSLGRQKGFVLSEYVRDMMLKQELLDQKNINFIDSIISIYGYPGLSLVGESACQSAWSIIQHSYEIDKYYHVLRKAYRKGEIPDSLFAKTRDRFLISNGRKQIYGTQTDCIPNEAGNFDCVVLPIRNVTKVNKRRKKVGLLTTIEEHARKNGYQFNVKKRGIDFPK